MRVQSEDRISTKLLVFLAPTETVKWANKIKTNIKKIKASPIDDFDTDFIDIDVLLNMYIHEFREAKYEIQQKLMKKWNKSIQENEKR